MTIVQLRYFLGVLAAGSFTRAAESLHVAQPAIGVQVRKLEDALGVRLLIRHSRGVVPTDAGRRLVSDAERLLAEVERIRQGIMEMGREPRGRIVLGLTDTAREALAARLVRSCRRDYPDVMLTIVGGPGHGLAERLSEGRVDMAVTCDPPANAGAVSEPLATEPLYFVAPPGHTLAEGAEIRLRAVLTADLVLPPEPWPIRRQLVEAARAAGADLRCVCEAETEPAMADLARRGVACAILPHGVVQRDAEAGHLAALRIIDPDIARTLYLVCSESRLGTPALDAVRNEIRALVAGLVASGAAGWTTCAAETDRED